MGTVFLPCRLCCVCTSWDCAPQDHLFLAFLLFVALCQLPKEASLVKGESCT